MIRSQLVNRPRLWLMRTSPSLYVLLARVAGKGMFRNERRALAGKVRPRVTDPSVLHFCYYRCGSRYVSSLIQRLLAGRGYQFIDYERYQVHCDREGMARFKDADFLMPRLHRQGMHYGPFYHYHKGFSELDDFRVVLTLRDPRDVMTSTYFSVAFGHTLYDRASIERRKRVREMGLDAFVLEQVGEVVERYTTYHEALAGRDNVLVLRYEEMVGNFEPWLSRLAEFIGSGDQREALEAIRAEADFAVKKEDKYSHRRSVKPGNFREKLKPETIEKLDEQLAGVLRLFNYTADGVQR